MEKILRDQLADGTFGDVPVRRSQMMQAVKGRGNKTTEIKFLQALITEGITGWEAHAKMLGNPDFYFSAYRVAVFLDGCFWHGCPQCGHVPKTNHAYWKVKMIRNIERDLEKTGQLQKSGHTVLRFWEHELENMESCIEALKETLDNALNKIIYYSNLF